MPDPISRIRIEPTEYRVFGSWIDAASGLGFRVAQDLHRENTFNALDSNHEVVGMFIMADTIFGGFLFNSYFDRCLFEQGF